MSPGQGDATTAQRRRRNATHTRNLLLEVASRRFAYDGYASTTVRDIADDAGVNVALISRYFASKEGLFEACLAAAVNTVRRDSDEITFDQLAAVMAHRITGTENDERSQEALLLLLRSSGDERIDDMRRGVLHSISERLATVTSDGRPRPGDDPALLRAQIILAMTMGIALLRSSLRLQPLAGATEEDLIRPLSDVINALLAPNIAAASGD